MFQNLIDMTNGLFVFYLIFINIAAFLLYWRDKVLARRGDFRVPESVLLGVALLGGSIGAFLSMNLFRHKTKKYKFKYGIPAILFLQICGFLLISTPGIIL